VRGRSADLQHQVEVVGVAELERAAEAAERGLLEAELEECLAEPGECILVLGLEHECFLEAAASPRIFLARQARVAHTYVQLDRGGVQREPLTQHGEGVVVVAFVVELVGALVILFGAQERGGHVTWASSS
jgi:hypothetical protein